MQAPYMFGRSIYEGKLGEETSCRNTGCFISFSFSKTCKLDFVVHRIYLWEILVKHPTLLSEGSLFMAVSKTKGQKSHIY